MHGALAGSELTRPRGGRRAARTLLTALSVLLAVTGGALIYVSQHTRRWAPPPVPPASAALGAPRPAVVIPHPLRVRAGLPRAPALKVAPLRRSRPVSVRVPAIGVDARIIPLGLGWGDTVQVPPLRTPMLASWFDEGAAPGQRGAAVLFGHVDSAVTGPAVFYRLGSLRPGDLIYVTRADRHTAVCRVNSVALSSQYDFPSRRVYGCTTRPLLRLVTCGGAFDTDTHLYLDRTIAFASYAGHL
jgi:Sortase domain